MCIYAHRRQHRIRTGHGSRGRQLTGERARGKDRKKGGEGATQDKAEPACIIPPEAFRIFIVTAST